MFFRNGFVFLPLLLSGCGMSLFAHNEYITFSDVDDVTPRQRETFQTEGLVLKGVFSNRKEEVASEKSVLSVEDVRISFEDKAYGAAGLFPFIPPPPYIPIFFNVLGTGCPVSSDAHLNIRYALKLKEGENIHNYIKMRNQGIYLIKADGNVVLPRHFWNDGYSYQICFPLKAEETDGAVLNISGITNMKGAAITVSPQRLHYYSDNGFMIGYMPI